MAFRLASRNGTGEGGKKGIAIFLGLIMLLSVAGFVLSLNPSGQGQNFRHAGLAFEQLPDGSYSAGINGRDVGFVFRPDDVSGLEVPEAVAKKLSGTKALYITYYWNSTLAQEMALFQFDMGNLLAAKEVYVQPAFTTESPVNISVRACGDATAYVPVLLMQPANNTAIGLDAGNRNCIVLNSSDSASFLRMADRLKYRLIEGDEK